MRGLNRVTSFAHGLIGAVLPIFTRGMGHEPTSPSEGRLRASLALQCGHPYGDLMIVDFDKNDDRARAWIRCATCDKESSACFALRLSSDGQPAWGMLTGEWWYSAMEPRSS